MTFLKRLFSTIVLLGVLCAIMIPQSKMISGTIFMISAAAASFFAVYETCSMLENAGRSTFKWPASVLAAVFSVCFYMILHLMTWGCVILYIIVFLSVFLAWASFLNSKQKIEYVEKIPLTFGIMILFLIPVFCIYNTFTHSKYLFLFLLMGTKIGDIGAYVFGSLSAKLMKGGNHKIFPTISPKKSWEGCIGGLIVSIAFGGIVYPYCTTGTGTVHFGCIIGALFYIFGAAGDLSESCIKRACNVKDSGKLFPGIGGMFDLIASLMMNSILFLVLQQFAY